MLSRLVALMPILILAGCASHPQKLGFSQQEWNAMSQKQQQKLWADHQKIVKNWQKEQIDTVYAGPELSIYMLKGSAMMPPFEKRYTFETFEFRIDPGKCRFLTLKSVDTTHKVVMRLCYNGLKLALDPSHYDLNAQDGTLFIDYNPIWKRGFTYSNHNTQGYARLRDASITVKAIPMDKSTRSKKT